MSSIRAEQDPSEMNYEQLRKLRKDQDNLNAAVTRTYHEIVVDAEDLEGILNDNWKEYLPLLIALARDCNLDNAAALHNKIHAIIKSRALARTLAEPKGD